MTDDPSRESGEAGREAARADAGNPSGAVPDAAAGGAADPGDYGSKSISGFSWQAGANLIQFVSQFAIGIALARLLFPDDFGVVAIATIATGFASTFTDLGLGPALIQRRQVDSDHVRTCFTFSTLAALLMGLLLLIAAEPIAQLFREPRVAPVLRVLSLIFPLSGLNITAKALLTRDLRFKTLVKVQLTASLVGWGGVAVFLAWAGFGYWALVWGQIVDVLLAALLGYGAVRHSLRPLFRKKPLHDLFGFSFGMFLTSTANYFALQGDYFVVGRLMDSASLGFYSRAYALMQMPMRFIGGAISRVMFPVASRVQDQPVRFRRAFLASFRISTAMSLPLSLILAVLAPELILTLYGERWAETIPLVQILALFGVFRMTYNTAAAFVRAKGQVYRLLVCQLFYAALVLGGSWFGASVAGLEGVAWGVGVAILGMWTLVVAMAVRAADVRGGIFLGEMARAAVPALGMCAVTLVIARGLRAVGVGDWGVLVPTAAAFGALFGVYLVVQARDLDHPAMNRVLLKIPGLSRWVSTGQP